MGKKKDAKRAAKLASKVALDADLRGGAGIHDDRRTKRERTRQTVKAAAIAEGYGMTDPRGPVFDGVDYVHPSLVGESEDSWISDFDPRVYG